MPPPRLGNQTVTLGRAIGESSRLVENCSTRPTAASLGLSFLAPCLQLDNKSARTHLAERSWVDFACEAVDRRQLPMGALEMAEREVPESCAKWLAEVDRVMKRDWFIDTEEAGLDDDDVVRYWKFGYTPEAFVAWHAEKYDLYDFRRPWGTLAGDPPHD